MFFSIRRPKRTEPIIQPMSAMPTRSIPVQKSQMQRPASHHAISSEVRKVPRPDLKGSVYRDTTVDHAPAARSSAGSSSNTHISTTPAAGPFVHARAIVDCHSASQLIGAISASTALCHSAGNSCAKESNMMIGPRI
jgi:hypothetical protein